jgi:AcrR family transcriptional regulator
VPPAAKGKAGSAAVTAVPATEAALFELLHPEEASRREDGIRLGSRGAATRARLMQAAREMFQENGYGQTSVAQISERAGVSQGAFYQYFRDRAHVMSALVDASVADMLRRPELFWHIEEGREGLSRLLGAWVASYEENAAFQRVWEEVSQIDPALADVRRRLTRLIEHGIESQLHKGVKAKIIPKLPDVPAVARALTSMADRYCYLTYAFDPPADPPSAHATAELLVDMWARAVGLTAVGE